MRTPRLSVMRDRGFTLLEVLVAITIIGTVSVVLMSGFGHSMRNVGLAEDYTTAAFLLEDVLIRHCVEGKAPGTYEGNFGDAFDRFNWKSVVSKPEEKPYLTVEASVVFVRGATERQLTSRTVILAPKNMVEGK